VFGKLEAQRPGATRPLLGVYGARECVSYFYNRSD